LFGVFPIHWELTFPRSFALPTNPVRQRRRLRPPRNCRNIAIFASNAVLCFLFTMEKDIHNRKQRLEAKRRNAIDSAIATIEAVAERRIDAYEGWQKVCGIFQNNAGLGLPELKQFVEIEGVHPNSTLSVTNELRDTIWRNAVKFLAAR
jgi:hypothetical protein